MNNKFIVVAFFILGSCKGVEEKTSTKYMDLKGFFEQETIRLTKANQKAEKTVTRNGVSETKKDFLPDWDVELSLFSESDINKPAWENSYKVYEDSTQTNYTALDNKLRTRSIRIRKNKSGILNEISIVNRTTNNLYSSTEELTYIPDSLYRIIKKQEVILLGNNNYEISGILK